MSDKVEREDFFKLKIPKINFPSVKKFRETPSLSEEIMRETFHGRIVPIELFRGGKRVIIKLSKRKFP